MSTHITIDELNDTYLKDSDKYYIRRAVVIASCMELGARYIESVRKINRDNKLFIKHTCECDDDGRTIWHFVYLREEVERFGIDKQLVEAWNAEFAIRGEKSDSVPYYHHDAQPCICPFSMR